MGWPGLGCIWAEAGLGRAEAGPGWALLGAAPFGCVGLGLAGPGRAGLMHVTFPQFPAFARTFGKRVTEV